MMKVDCTLLNLDVNDLITDFSSNQFDSNMTIPNIKEKLCHLLYFFLFFSLNIYSPKTTLANIQNRKLLT